MFASACLRLISANAATLRSSRRKSCTTDMPVMFSCRKALMRAIHLRTSRKEVRDPRRNQLVTTKKSGITEKVTRARRQFIHTMTPMIPNSVNRSPNTVTTPGGEQLVHRVHVGGDAGHQAAHRVLVEVGHGQPLQVGVDRAPHVHHHLLPGDLEDPDLAEADGKGGQQRGEVQERDRAQPAAVFPADVAVDGDLGEPGADEVERGHDHDEEERDRDRRLVGPQVPEQADEQPPVVLLGEGVLFVEGAGHAVCSISSSRSWRRCRSA